MVPTLWASFLCLLPLAAGLSARAPGETVWTLDNAGNPDAIDNNYLVLWKSSLNESTLVKRQAHVAWFLRKRNLHKRDSNGVMLSIDHQDFSIGKSFNLMQCQATAEDFQIMMEEIGDDVEMVEANQVVTIGASIQSSTSRLLTRQAAPAPGNRTTIFAGTNATAKATTKGAGTTIYVLDTGVNTQHKAFGGRATMLANFVQGESEQDLNGHGTHCAGSAAGEGIGTAPEAQIKGVKILNAKGSGRSDSIISGMSATCEDVRQNNLQGKAVASMSFGTSRSNVINRATDQLSACGVTVLVAAGNEKQDAENVSPASSESSITVGATNDNRQLASFSNTGERVDISATGVDVCSADAKDPNGFTLKSGTSMSTPTMAGLAANVLSAGDVQCRDDCSSQVKKALQNMASNDLRLPQKAAGTPRLEIDTSDTTVNNGRCDNQRHKGDPDAGGGAGRGGGAGGGGAGGGGRGGGAGGGGRQDGRRRQRI